MAATQRPNDFTIGERRGASGEVPAGVRLVAPSRAADPYREMDLLRLSTAGSVDDGKSTLIGRLLYDTKSIFQDQLQAIDDASRRRGEDYLNLALLTDGLRAEREQNITIDVAYRFFATPRRKFIIADTPGHVQYTRNMVTGASTAELTIVLVDARKGVLTQSKRHGFIASLLRIPHIVVAVNKMDLVDYSEEVFTRIADEYREFAEKLDVTDLVFIPISALKGDNVVERSASMPWYSGSTLLHHLESVNVGADRNLVDFRFPVQYVVRPNQDFRGFAGRVASGTIQPGEEVVALPSGRQSRIRSIETAAGPSGEAVESDSVVLTLEDEIDISRGDMLVRTMNVPTIGSRFEAILCWLNPAPLDPSVPYVLLHTSRTVRGFVSRVHYRINVDTLHREPADVLGLNEIGRVEVTTAQPIFYDPYGQNRVTGSFVLVDPFTNVTVAAGMIRGEVRTAESLFGSTATEAGTPTSPNVTWEEWNIPRARREARNGHRAAVLWFTGLSGSGKSTIARRLEARLFASGCQTMLLDGDQLRHGVNGDLGFSPEDRRENVRRAGEVARLFFEQGSIVLATFVSPYRADRERVRALFPDGGFLEIYAECDVAEAARRDPKGLYRKAARGEITDLTGVAAPYEAPTNPELVAHTQQHDVDQIVAQLLRLLREREILPPSATTETGHD
jgi:bifunctional enzyme CysN/CysC